MNAALPMNTETMELVEQIRSMITEQEAVEVDSDMPDMNMAMVSLGFARENLAKIWLANTPDEYVRKYVQILENRYRRITEEDAGEFGSGRDALGNLITKLEDLSGVLR